jgi:hypothetical protein
MVGPIIDELANTKEGCSRKIDVDANQEFAAKYGVETYQQYLFFITVK